VKVLAQVENLLPLSVVRFFSSDFTVTSPGASLFLVK
jgi:hypothetical protein